ncbi:MAG: hypothetical protein ACR2KX_13375 [Chitinophagaceae bacterium]
MSEHYPIKFTLEDGVHVTVNKTGDNTYDFTLKPEKGPERHFSFADDQPRNDLIELLDFDQLNAVRRFWLEQEMM